MNSPESYVSQSGVRISADFRSNLIIDRYDPVFADMRASKRKHLQSANSEDAVTWNVFRSLRQIDPEAWLPDLWLQSFPSIPCPDNSSPVVDLWKSVAPPPGLLEGGDEGHSEIDVVIESPNWVWFIEAKYLSDISLGTTTRPTRDQLLRNIDVGSYYAGIRDFYFSLLISSEKRSSHGVQKIKTYSNLSVPRSELALHRPDGLKNLKGVSLLTWAALGKVLEAGSTAAKREDERMYAIRAVTWLRERGFIQA
jgi:hypothetical protein